MDVKRFTSAILGFPIVALVLILGNKILLDIVVAIFAIIALNEYFNVISNDCKPVRWVGYAFAVLIAFMHIIPMAMFLKILLISIPILILLLFSVIIITDMKVNFNDICFTLFGILYIVIFAGCIPFIYGVENGKYLIWYLLTTSWGTDTFAYLIGKRYGVHKFSGVSPKKSIEGCIAGIIGAIILSCLYTYGINVFFNVNYNYGTVIVISTILSIIGQIGDFAASSIKRYVNVKDFGTLIPGHGGILDRIDSLIFIAPFAYILLGLL